ncbi:MAG: shikimate dehydrogenase [bacterium]|nr:shikimate dehydrogenase [bacterium]
MMIIKGSTKVLGIFGCPVDHSLSPAMQNAAIRQLGLDMVYVPWEVKPGALKSALDGVRAMGIRGINITIPHKEEALKYLDEISYEVQLIGAANTVVNNNGVLTGHNTDGRGLLLSLKENHRFSSSDKCAVIIGAGGAARGIAASLALSGASKILLINRTEEKALALAKELSGKISETTFLSTGLDSEEIKAFLPETDILINTSSAGMNGKNNLALPLNLLPADAIVADIVYKPLETALLSKARKLGLKTEDGLGMLACQGAMSFELWTGKLAPTTIMKKALTDFFI